MSYTPEDKRYLRLPSVDKMFLTQASDELAEEERKERPRQPPICVGCAWGRWEGNKQFCLRIQCVKGGTCK